MAAKLTDEQVTQWQTQFAMWRYHLWSNNFGSYKDIENKVERGELTPLVCPIENCDCNWQQHTE